MLTQRSTTVSCAHQKVFSATLVLPFGLLLVAVSAATPSPEEVADAFDCASALNDKVSKRDVSLNEGLASLSQEGATAAKEEQTEALEQDALLHQELASRAEEQKTREATRHQQLLDSAEIESNKRVDSLKQEIAKVEAEEQKATEQLAQEERTLQKLKDFNEKFHKSAAPAGGSAEVVERLEAAQSRVAYAGKADDLRKLSKAFQGEDVLQEAGDLGSTQVDIQHGEQTAAQGKRTLEECLRGKTSFLRNKKIFRHL